MLVSAYRSRVSDSASDALATQARRFWQRCEADAQARVTPEAFETWQKSLLRQSQEFERTQRPKLRASFATGHALGCDCSACDFARLPRLNEMEVKRGRRAA
jgi:hypothetical protein